MRSAIVWAALASLLMTGIAQADGDISVCPKVADITAARFKRADGLLKPPYDEGYQYDAPAVSGKNWHGETLGSQNSYLEKKYELRLEGVDVQAHKTVCSYTGTTLIDSARSGVSSTPYLKLIQEK